MPGAGVEIAMATRSPHANIVARGPATGGRGGRRVAEGGTERIESSPSDRAVRAPPEARRARLRCGPQPGGILTRAFRPLLLALALAAPRLAHATAPPLHGP